MPSKRDDWTDGASTSVCSNLFQRLMARQERKCRRVSLRLWLFTLTYLFIYMQATVQQPTTGRAFGRKVVRRIVVAPPPSSVWPHLFRGAGHDERRGEQLKWSMAFRLYIESFPSAQLPGPVHTARLDRVCFCVLSLGLRFVYSFVLFDLFVCPHSFMFPWAVESSPLQFLALA